MDGDADGGALVFDGEDADGDRDPGGGWGEAAAVGADGDGAMGGLDDVVAADKAGDEGVGGALEDVAGGAGLADVAVFHDDHLVGEGHGFLLAVGDVDEGDGELALQALELLADLDAEEGVEGGEGFVEEEDTGADDEGAGEGDALLLASGELGGEAVGEVGHVDETEELAGAAVSFGFADALHAEAEGDVVAAVEVGEEGVALEHHGGGALDGREIGDVAALDEDVAGGDCFVAGDHAQRAGLAAAAGAEEAAVAGFRDAEGDGVDRRGGAEAFGNVDELDVVVGVHQAALCWRRVVIRGWMRVPKRSIPSTKSSKVIMAPRTPGMVASWSRRAATVASLPQRTPWLVGSLALVLGTNRPATERGSPTVSLLAWPSRQARASKSVPDL